MAFIHNDYSEPNASYGGGSTQLIRQADRIAPWIPYKKEDGSYGSISDGNPAAWVDINSRKYHLLQNFSGILAFDYHIIDGLTFTLQGAYVTNIKETKDYRKECWYDDVNYHGPDQLGETISRWSRYTLDALLNYDKTFNQDHHFKAMVGYKIEKYDYRNLYAFRKSFPNSEVTDLNGGDSSTQTNSGYSRELALLSYFGRLNYDYKGKYLLEANFRADASSRFAKGYRWGYFPSFSGAWRISEEAFMESAKDSWLSGLKIRASWGQLGNQDALSGSNNDYYPALNTYNLDSKYAFGGSLNSGYYQRKYRLETISWEKASTWGVGVDFTLFNKLNGSLDYYNRKTTGIIMDVTVPKEFALDAYKDNVGSMRNSGIEINLSYNTKIGQVDFGIAGNFSYNKNEILDLGGGDPNKYLDATDGYSQRNKVGEAMNSYYIYRADGFFNSQEEADAYTAKYGNPFGKTFKAGDLRYVDTNKDGKLTADDREYCGSSDPKIIYGFNINAGWKGIDLSLMFNGAAGVKRLFDVYEVYGNFSGDAAHPASIWRDAWTPDNHDASMPRIFYDTNSASSSRSVQSDFWLQDTSYLRLKNLQLGYTLPKGWLNSVGVENIRIYYSVENLLTFDKMKINIDPESTSQRLSSYPLLRTHAFGANVTF